MILLLALLGGCRERGEPGLRDTANVPAALLRNATWDNAGLHLTTARFRHTATLLPDGRVLLVGGATQVAPYGVAFGTAPNASAELFDPTTGTFKAVAGKLAHARWGHTATLLHDGRVLIAGGFGQHEAALASAELYDPATETFTPTGDLGHPRAWHTATLLADDRVLILGGVDEIEPFYGPSVGKDPHVTPPFPTPEEEAAVVSEALAYQPQEGQFAALGSAFVAFGDNGLTVPSWSLATALLPDGRVAIAWAQIPRVQTEQGTVPLLYFDPRDNRFTSVGEAHCPTSGACGEIFLHYEAGPHGLDPSRLDVVTKQNELQLDPQLGTWVAPPHQPVTSDHDTAPPFNVMTFDPSRGPLMVGSWLGGFGSSPKTLSWNHNDRFWSNAGDLARPRAWPTATTLASGRILVTGGLDGTPLSSTEESSTEVATSEVPKLGSVTGDAQATLLADGRVLFTGGNASKTIRAWTVPRGLSLNASPEYDARGDIQTFREAWAGRSGHQSFLLPSGNVLLAGGDTVPADAEEELFDPMSQMSRPLGFRLKARGSGLALSGNRYLFAGPDQLQLLDANDFSLHDIDLASLGLEPLGCAAPGLARLLDGRVAVVGQHSLFELEPNLSKASTTIALRTPRCDVALTALPDRSLVIAGGTSPDNAEAAGTALEIYDPSARTLNSRELGVGVVSARALVRFSNLMLLGRNSQVNVSWTSGERAPSSDGPTLSRQQRTVITLADGSVLRTSNALDPTGTRLDLAERLDTMPSDSSDLDLSGPPLEVTPDRDLDIAGLRLSKAWPENSGGTSQGSATNTPIAIWLPLFDGWPVLGTLKAWSEDRATWHVPHPAFPGLGIFGYVLSGTLHPLRLVRINELPQKAECANGSECATGYCVDGVCCDRACDGTCEACRGVAEGQDGICSSMPADAPDPLCSVQDVKTCGRTGLCAGNRQCALFADGQVCGRGRRCEDQICTRQDNCNTSSDCINVGDVCNATHKCQAPFGPPRTALGCGPGCLIASRQSASELWGVALALAIAASRRRSRRVIAATNRSAP